MNAVKERANFFFCTECLHKRLSNAAKAREVMTFHKPFALNTKCDAEWFGEL